MLHMAQNLLNYEQRILQTAFLKMVATRAGLRSNDRVVAWFYQILRNALRDHYRRHYVEQRAHLMAADAAERFRAPEPDPELEDAVCRCVTSLLGTLKRSTLRFSRRWSCAAGRLQTSPRRQASPRGRLGFGSTGPGARSEVDSSARVASGLATVVPTARAGSMVGGAEPLSRWLHTGSATPSGVSEFGPTCSTDGDEPPRDFRCPG